MPETQIYPYLSTKESNAFIIISPQEAIDVIWKYEASPIAQHLSRFSANLIQKLDKKKLTQ